MPLPDLPLSFQTFMVMVWTWELFMMPIFLLLLIGWNYFQVTPGRVSSNQDLVSVSSYCTVLYTALVYTTHVIAALHVPLAHSLVRSIQSRAASGCQDIDWHSH